MNESDMQDDATPQHLNEQKQKREIGSRGNSAPKKRELPRSTYDEVGVA